jgi:hypothetical protein
MSKPPRHTEATRAECQRAVDAANAAGRQTWGSRWAPDMLGCDTPCKLCLSKVAATEALAKEAVREMLSASVSS